MSNISIDVPVIIANAYDFQNLIPFIFKHERLLKDFGAIKIQPHVECKQSLKKRRANFPSCSNIQQVTQISKDELIYSINSETSTDKFSFDQSLSINENVFWESLSYSNDEKQQRSNLTVFPNKSFYCTRPRRSNFDLHRLPRLSLLKIGGRKVIRHCVPSLLRAHGPGAIFPLSSAHHRLFSIDYHHEGGDRQWYIIPAEERQKLEQIIKCQNSSMCLEQKNLLINPLVFDKYHIRYHRVIQHPNEFVVLAAGALAQGFAQNTSWNETIVFALPSWIQDGHAIAQTSLCSCHLNCTSRLEPIDITQFRFELVQKWTAINLKFPTDDKPLVFQEDSNNTKIVMPITPTDNEIDLLDGLDELTMDTTSMVPSSRNNQQNTFSRELPVTSSKQFPPELLVSPISNYSWHDENNDRTNGKQFQVDPNNSIGSDEIIQSTNINQRFTTENNFDEQLLPFDFMDFLSNTSVTVQSTQYQTNEQIDIYQNNKKQEWSCPIMNSTSTYAKNIKKEKIRNEEKSNDDTLYVSGLRNEVTKMDIRRHFVGCIKVIMKQHQMPPYLKYAFVVHRTSFQTEKNRRRPIDYRLFGSKCRVEYADRYFHARYEQKPFTVVVTRIPENITENQLRCMFDNCNSLKYYPGRTAYSMEVGSTKKQHDKILTGYAFLQYSNAQQATSVVENSAQYRINDVPLHVSHYTTKRSLYSTTK